MIHHPAENRWCALFLAFQSQALHTDDETGHALPGSRRFEDVVRGTIPDEHEFNDGIVRIVGALVNPSGHDPGMESVTLLNVSPEPIDLAGWQIANRNDDRFTIAAVTIGAGETVRIVLPADVAPLGNQGSEISLLDRQAARVHGVAYTARAGEPPGLDPQLLKPRVSSEVAAATRWPGRTASWRGCPRPWRSSGAKQVGLAEGETGLTFLVGFRCAPADLRPVWRFVSHYISAPNGGRAARVPGSPAAPSGLRPRPGST